MKISLLKRIIKEDLAKASKEALPAWVDKLIEPINIFIENVGQALQNRLSFGDNFYCKQVTLTFTSGVALEINPTTPYASAARAYGVIPLSSSGAVVSTFVWSNKSNGNVSATFAFVSATESECTLLILLR